MIALRSGTPADAAAVAALWHAGWHDAHAGHVPPGLTAGRTSAEFAARAPLRVADTTVLEVDGAVVGFVMVVCDEVEQVYLAASHRGSGLAEVLLDEAERQVTEGGYGEAWLAVVEGNARARRFYEKRGWRDDGSLPYEVVSGGATHVSPCRRYAKAVGPLSTDSGSTGAQNAG